MKFGIWITTTSQRGRLVVVVTETPTTDKGEQKTMDIRFKVRSIYGQVLGSNLTFQECMEIVKESEEVFSDIVYIKNEDKSDDTIYYKTGETSITPISDRQ